MKGLKAPKLQCTQTSEDYGGNGNTPIPWGPFYRVVIVLLLSCYFVVIVVLLCCYSRVTVLLLCCYCVVMSIAAHVVIL